MSVQKAIFPGVIIGILCLVGLTSLLMSTPGKANASPEKPAAGVAASNSGTVEQKQDTGCSISGSYPQSVLQWCGIIERYARENGLDPNLVSAVMLQESAGQPDAYSKSGAVGLLQVMPRDGVAAGFLCQNGPCFASRPSIEELQNPDFNVSYGTKMLAGLIQKNGDIREALRAYGPKDVGYYYADIILGIAKNHE